MTQLPAKDSLTGRSVSRIIFSDDGASSYHGQTSALFEDNIHDRRKHKGVAVAPEWRQKGLMAEAALQRKATEVSVLYHSLICSRPIRSNQLQHWQT